MTTTAGDPPALRALARIDLNFDAGESEDTGTDEALLRVVTSANLACGVHGGSEEIIGRLSGAALERGVGVGAHPGLPSGRKLEIVPPETAAQAVRSQVLIFLRASRAPLQHVKLHGWLYHLARDPAVARAVVEVLGELPAAILVAQAGSPLERIGREAGLRVAAEGFLDRAYQPDGTLVPRGRRGAVLIDPGEVAARAVELALKRRVVAVNGQPVPVEADTLCLHGDTPGALELGKAARSALEAAGVQLRPMGAA